MPVERTPITRDDYNWIAYYPPHRHAVTGGHCTWSQRRVSRDKMLSDTGTCPNGCPIGRLEYVPKGNLHVTDMVTGILESLAIARHVVMPVDTLVEAIDRMTPQVATDATGRQIIILTDPETRQAFRITITEE